ADTPKDDVKKEVKQFQGSWTIESLEVNGTMLSNDQFKDWKMTIKDDKYTVDLGNNSLKQTFTVDPGKKPKTIDLTASEGDNKGKTYKGIYELDKDTFKMCRPLDSDANRPTEFDAKEGSGMLLVVYKRAKPEK